MAGNRVWEAGATQCQDYFIRVSRNEAASQHHHISAEQELTKAQPYSDD